MANHKSSAKRAKQTIRKTQRNRQYISSVRTAVKKFYAAISEGKDAETIKKLLEATQSIVAKAAAKGHYHSNKAYRTISRLAKASVKAAAPGEAATATKKKAPAKKKTTKAAPKAAAKKKATKKK